MGEYARRGVSAKTNYAVRAAVELATAEEGDLVKGEQVAEAQAIPIKFLENILVDLRQAGIVNSRRGPEGGYWLARPAAEVTVADVMRAAEGPLASVRGGSPRTWATPARPSRCATSGWRCARACATFWST